MRANRAVDGLRPVEIVPHFTQAPAGSALIRFGATTVLCTASVVDGVPAHRAGRGGWLTAEYSMVPGSTGRRSARESSAGRVKGRTHEIQRLIGRSLRAAVDLGALGERTIHMDCEVLQADAGTRTASITGGFVALVFALERLMEEGELATSPLCAQVAAVSCGVVGDTVLLDLDYAEDSRARVDANLVRANPGGWLEVQATGEDGAFGDEELSRMLTLGAGGIVELMELQRQALGSAARVLPSGTSP